MHIASLCTGEVRGQIQLCKSGTNYTLAATSSLMEFRIGSCERSSSSLTAKTHLSQEDFGCNASPKWNKWVSWLTRDHFSAIFIMSTDATWSWYVLFSKCTGWLYRPTCDKETDGKKLFPWKSIIFDATKQNHWSDSNWTFISIPVFREFTWSKLLCVSVYDITQTSCRIKQTELVLHTHEWSSWLR